MKLIDYGVTQWYPKLGDCIVYNSAFTHYREVSWLHTVDNPIPEVWRQMAPMYNSNYHLEIVHGLPKVTNKNFMMESAKDGVRIAEANFLPRKVSVPREPYVTYQLDSSHPSGARDIVLHQVKEQSGGMRMVSLDSIKRDRKSIRTLLSILAGAEYHVGPDSGCAWAAITARTPVKLILPDYNKLTAKEQMMHECARALMSIQEDVEFIE